MIGRADRFTVLLDANVLVGALKRNMLLSLAEVGLFRPRWSASILEEVERALIKLYSDEEMAKRLPRPTW
ncbi:MAG: PIN domain-containing protein [Myxococcota bacterium]